MAVQVILDLTDAQWEVIQDYYPQFLRDFMRESDEEVLTPENLASYLLRDIKSYITNDIGLRKIDSAILNVFN